MTLGTLAIFSVIQIWKFCGLTQYLLFTESSTSCNFVTLLSSYSLQSHPHLAISWTCSALTPYRVICVLQFRDPAQRLLFTESSTPRNFVTLLSAYSSQSHPHLAISWTCSALTLYQFIHPLSFKQNLNRITTTNSTSLCQKAPVVMIMTRAFLNVLLLISYIRILYIYLRSLSINPVKRPGFS